jgi:protein-S-isoprenylcysteine O-methyltransferase Ste14
MKRYKDWARREYSLKQRAITLVFAGIIFVLLIPVLLVMSSAAIDAWLNIPRFTAGVANRIAGSILTACGLLLAQWTIYIQMAIGRGTPIPAMPTQKLIVEGPFTWCRNPMTLGTFLVYLGIAVWTGSISAVVLVATLTALLLLYLKKIEEKELEARFGEEYLEYKQHTPFIIPRFGRH